MRSPTKRTSRALVAAGAGGLLVLGAAFGAGGVGAASADDTPPTAAQPERPTRGASERPGTLPPEPPTTASPEPPITAAPGQGTLPPLAAPAHGVPPYGG